MGGNYAPSSVWRLARNESIALTLLCVGIVAELLHCLCERLQEEVEEFLLQWSCALLDVTLLALDHRVEGSKEQWIARLIWH